GDLFRVRLHAGTAEILARVRPLGALEIPPGATGYAQFRLERPAVMAPGDRFIFRRYSPATTLGGGVVLDALPVKHRRAEGAPAEALKRIDGADLAVRAEWAVAQAGARGVPADLLSRRVGAGKREAMAALQPAVGSGAIVALGPGPDLLISSEGLAEIET